MNHLRTRWHARVVPFVVASTIIGASVSCSPPAPAPNTGLPPGLWGTMTPVVSVKELMRDMLDPIADNIFDAVGVIEDSTGIHERVPTSDADWEKIRIGAVTMAEGAYLLKVPRPWAPPGDNNNSEGPDAPELSPAEIEAKVKGDPVEWNARIEALRNVGLQVMDIVKRRDTAELWDASENLDTACEACHRSYWYPHEDAEFYKKLDQKLRELPVPQSR